MPPRLPQQPAEAVPPGESRRAPQQVAGAPSISPIGRITKTLEGGVGGWVLGGFGVDGTWSFHLRAAPEGGTRLVVRTRNRSRPRLLNGLFGVLVGEPVHFIMQTRQFHNLRTRVALSPHRSAGRRSPRLSSGPPTHRAPHEVPPSMRYIVRKSDYVRPIVAGLIPPAHQAEPVTSLTPGSSVDAFRTS
jgi:hypothetical protein